MLPSQPLSQVHPVTPAGLEAGWLSALDPAIPLLDLLERLVDVFQQPPQVSRPVRLWDAHALSQPVAAPATQLFRQAEAALQRLRQPSLGRMATEDGWRRCALVLPVSLQGQTFLLPLRLGHQRERDTCLDHWSLEFQLTPRDVPERLEVALRLRATELSLQALCGTSRQAARLQESVQGWVGRLLRAGLQVDLWIASLDARS